MDYSSIIDFMGLVVSRWYKIGMVDQSTAIVDGLVDVIMVDGTRS